MPLYLWFTELFGNISLENFLRVRCSVLSLAFRGSCRHLNIFPLYHIQNM